MFKIFQYLLHTLGRVGGMFLAILFFLLVAYLLFDSPERQRKAMQGELDRAELRLIEAREMVDGVTGQLESAKVELERTRNTLNEIDSRRRALDGFLKKVMDVFRQEEVAKEKAILNKKADALRAQLNLSQSEVVRMKKTSRVTEAKLASAELNKVERQGALIQFEQEEARRSGWVKEIRKVLPVLAFKAITVLAGLLIIPFLWQLVAYYVLARIAATRRPIQFSEKVAVEMLETSDSRPAQRIELAVGERLLTKVQYLQSSADDGRKSTKWLMDWSYPFTSLAAGLYILTEIHCSEKVGGNVTLSSPDNATEELAVVNLKVGQELVIRPSFLAALVYSGEEIPRIKSRWMIWRLQSWISLRFRYLIVTGPTRLIFTAQRGIQAEVVSAQSKGRRVNSGLPVAFSPSLKYSPLRAETFVAYFRGMNGLFDDFFRGEGTVIQQQVRGKKGTVSGRFWSGFGNAIGKVFGV